MVEINSLERAQEALDSLRARMAAWAEATGRQVASTPNDVEMALVLGEAHISRAAGLADDVVTGEPLPEPIISEEHGYLETARFFLASENGAFFAAAQARIDQMQADLDALSD